MKKAIRVLLVDDDEDDAILTINNLLENGYEPFHRRVFSLEALNTLLTNEKWDCIISDYALQNFNGLEALDEFLKHNLEIPFILLSDTIGEALAVTAMKSGASDYIMKNHLALLSSALDRELHEAETRRQNKEKDRSIRNDEIFFKSIIEKSFDIITLIDSKGKVIYTSPSNFKLLGYTTYENLGRSIFEILHNEDRPILEEAIKSVLDADGNSEFLTLRMKHKDNSWLWFEGTCSNLLKEVAVNAIILNFQETTKRRLAENALLESERFNRATLDALSTSIAVIDEQGEIIFVNKAWRDFGKDNSLLPLQKQEGYNYLEICDIVPVESEDFAYAKSAADGIRSVIHGEIQTFHLEYPCNSPNEERWFILRVTRFDSKQPVYVTISHQNISERKKAEIDLRLLNQTLEIKVKERTTELKLALEKAEESENKLQQAFLTCPESVTFTSLDTGVYTSVNYGFTKLLEYSEREAIGKTSVELQVWPSEEDRYRFKQLLKTDGRIENQEFQFLTKSGKLIDCLVSCSIIQINEISYIFSITRDISDRKAIQAELFEAKKTADEANLRKSEFLANMSHEIRTPLNAIVGFSTILQEKAEGNKLFTEYLDNIIQSSKVLLNLINDILDLSKVEAGRMVVTHKPVNMKILIAEILSVFTMKAYEKGITLITSISKDLPGSLIMDEKYLRQIFFNLIGNAVKFTQTGSVEIGVAIIPKNEERSKVDFLISIKDSGIGIPESEIKNIFEPFIQVARQSRSKYGGTGLGLSITRRLVELLGGTISVESKPGNGSIFNVSLFDIEIGALKTDEEIGNSRNWLKKIRFKNPTVLMAEDVLSNRQVIKLYLEPLGITVVEVENGEDCIAYACKLPPDLILMDMQMPVMDGYTAAGLLKADNNLKNIPIIALTASGIGEEKDRFANIADDFLLKPVYKNDLLEILTKYLPFELEAEIIKTDIPIDTIATPLSTKEPLTVETKFELLQKYLPTVTELQQTLNFDNLIAFEKDLEKFSVEQDIIRLKDYCSELKDCIETFNTEKIYTTLMEISMFMKKEESWKL